VPKRCLLSWRKLEDELKLWSYVRSVSTWDVDEQLIRSSRSIRLLEKEGRQVGTPLVQSSFHLCTPLMWLALTAYKLSYPKQSLDVRLAWLRILEQFCSSLQRTFVVSVAAGMLLGTDVFVPVRFLKFERLGRRGGSMRGLKNVLF
jgi:hypothetical protein